MLGTCVQALRGRETGVLFFQQAKASEEVPGSVTEIICFAEISLLFAESQER